MALQCPLFIRRAFEETRETETNFNLGLSRPPCPSLNINLKAGGMRAACLLWRGSPLLSGRQEAADPAGAPMAPEPAPGQL